MVGRSRSWTELFRAVLADHEDQQAWESLHARVLSLTLIEYARHKPISLLDVEDIAQNLLLELLENGALMREVAGAESPSAMLGTIARRRILDGHRKARSEQHAIDTLQGDTIYELSRRLAHGSDLDHLDELEDCLKRVTPSERLLLVMIYVEEVPTAEIARRLAIRPSTVATRAFRVLERLRAELGGA